MRTRVKICGFTRVEDAVYAARLGIDAIGLVFYPPSSRFVSINGARQIVAALPPFVTVVGLFVDAPSAWISEVLAKVPVDLLQFHGDESPETCRAYRRPYIKVVRMREGVDLFAIQRHYADAAGLLLDAFDPQAPGGTGSVFDWRLVPEGLTMPLIVAGGLHPGNVKQAILAAQPYGVDVSSGVEALKGIKDKNKMVAFLNEVNQCDYN